MATLTIRGLSSELIDRLRAVAERRGLSMEEEVRQLLRSRYVSREEVLQRARERWKRVKPPTARQVQEWIDTGRR